MADNSVFITGASKGAFEDALATLPPWATEKTAGKISGLLAQQVKILNDIKKNAMGGSGGTSGLSPQDQAKYTSELEKALKLITDNNKEEAKALKRAKEREAADKKSLLGGKQFDNKWQKWQFALDSLAVVGKKVFNAETQYLKTYDAMYKSGVNVLAGQNDFTDGFQALNHVVTQTGLRLETLQEISQKYASSINAVGFMKFAKASGIAATNLKEFGFSAKDSAEMVGVYTEMQSHYTDMRGKSDQEIAAGATTFSKAVHDTSFALGKSREEVIANAKALSKSTDTFVSTAILGADATAHMNNTLMGIDPEFAQTLSKSAALASQNLEYSSDNLVHSLATSGSRYTMQFDKLVRALPTESMEQIHARAGAMANDPAFRKAVAEQALLASQGVAGAADQLKAMQAVTEIYDHTSKVTKGQQANADKTETTITNIQTQMEKLGAVTEAAFSPTIAQVTLLGDSLKSLNDVLYGVINKTNPEARSNVGAGLMGAGMAAGGLGAYKGMRTIANLAKGPAGKESAEIAAKGAGLAAKGGGKMLGRLLPGIGLAFGVYDAIERASKGDYTGAGIAGASGIASLFPGLGTAVALGLDATNLARDYTTPKATTINSPSAVSAAPTPAADTASSAPNPSTPVSPGIEKTPANADINSTLTFQSNLLSQILLTTENLVSVNKDILKYTRNRT